MKSISAVIERLGLFVMLLLFLIGIRPAPAQPGFGQIWQKDAGNPLFSIIGAPGSWNGVPSASILVAGRALWDETEYKLYIGGFNGQKWAVGLVSSPTLESGWSYYAGNPVLTGGGPGAWDESGVGLAMVIKDEGIYKMWFTGRNANNFEAIGYATSPDGVTWSKFAGNPVLEVTPGSWEGESVLGSYVIKEGNTYKMWYYGSTGAIVSAAANIGYATSPDGINWSKSPENPVLEVGAPGSWDNPVAGGPVVLFDRGKYLMWYTGSNAPTLPPGFPQSGFAISDDGIHWTKDEAHNPVLPGGGAPGKWDMFVAIVIQVVKENGTYKMLYGGSNLQTTFAVGLATLLHPYVLLADKDVEISGQVDSEGDIHANNDIEFDRERSKTSRHSGNLTAVDDIKIEKKNEIIGNATAGGKVRNSGTITGTVTENAQVDPVLFPFLSFTAGGADIRIPRRGSEALPPGSYGIVDVGKKATLELAHNGMTGEYFMEELKLDEKSILSVNTATGPVTINVTEQLKFEEGMTVVILPSGESGTAEVTFNSLQTRKLKIEEDVQVLGTIIAPDASVELEKNSRLKGAICARKIEVERKVTFLPHHSSTSLLLLPAPLANKETGESELEIDPVVEDYELHQNFPNPFNPVTTIRFSIPVQTEVSLVIYNALGQEVERLIDRSSMAPGQHAVQWAPRALPSGIYFYRLTTVGFTQSRKMILMK